VDSADVYADGRAEEIIGRWLAARPGRRELVVLASKGRFPTDEGPNGHGLSRRHLSLALDASLRRLNVETIDLYQVHAWDPLTRLEETLRFLDGAMRAGKINYPGGGERRRGDADLEPARPVRADLAVLDVVRKVADGRGVSLAQVAIAWLMGRPAVSSVILGARSMDQLTDNMAAAGLKLTAEEIQLLNEASEPPAPDYPYGVPGQSQRSRRIQGGRF
jgi:aryl-alcohol dehydrogenase-like predicted oxidoreductase